MIDGDVNHQYWRTSWKHPRRGHQTISNHQTWGCVANPGVDDLEVPVTSVLLYVMMFKVQNIENEHIPTSNTKQCCLLFGQVDVFSFLFLGFHVKFAWTQCIMKKQDWCMYWTILFRPLEENWGELGLHCLKCIVHACGTGYDFILSNTDNTDVQKYSLTD